jgi:hypothetical protein
MLLLFILLVPLAFAWKGWLESDENRVLYRRLSTAGLLLISLALVLFIAVGLKLDGHRIYHQVAYLKRCIFSVAFFAIPFLSFERGLTRWMGLASAISTSVFTYFAGMPS